MGAAISASGLPRSSLFVTTKVPCCPSPTWQKFTNLTEASLTARTIAGLTLTYSQAFCDSFATKFGNTSQQIEMDLEMLGLDYIDLLLIHWPCDTFEDNLRTYRVLEEAVKAGKAKAIGFSNFDAALVLRVQSLFCLMKLKWHSSGQWNGEGSNGETLCESVCLLYCWTF